ncbi:ABC transporter ATP-binding protein/permease [Mycoplasmopsis pulmonis]|uniref:ABC transporter ATP-binding protein/permease n=1 Tax=Mycoplasmopsis pulmonis TaxID=2107 RepID=UPI0010051B5D|nr:ATP-binding cassette domain-containing protein [Mycoplasmopsis pulmonis]VEU68389.1 ABC transporter ATPase [Mycoplasmopsis pulmonis]
MLKIENLTKKYGHKIVLDNLNLEIENNSLTFIVGKSGVGKSTLLNLIANFEKPEHGLITFTKDEKTINLLDSKKEIKIDFITQKFDLMENLSAIDNILTIQHALGYSVDKKEIITLFEKFNFPENVIKEKVKNLSGGEKQRVAILRSSINNNNILIADEPTGNLDQQNAHQVLENLKFLSQKQMVIVVSHDLNLAQKFADKIIHLDEGKIAKIEDLKKTNFENENKLDFKLNKEQKFLNKFKPVSTLVFNDFRRNFIQFISLIFLLFISFFSISKVIELQKVETSLVSKNIAYLDADKISLSPKSINEEVKNWTNVDWFLKTHEDKIKNSLKTHERKSVSVSYNGKSINIIDLDEVHINDFYRERFIGNEDILGGGRFLENDEEIILSEEIVEKLNIEDPINKIIKLEIQNQVLDVKIVGVNKVKSFESINFQDSTRKRNVVFSYLSWNLFEKIHQKEISQLTNFAIQPLEKRGDTISIGRETFLIDQNNLTLIEKDEIQISEILANKILAKLGIKVGDKRKFEYFLSLRDKQGRQRNDKKISLDLTKTFQSSKEEIRISKRLLDLLKGPHYNSANIYLKNNQKFEDLENSLKQFVPDWELRSNAKIYANVLLGSSLSFNIAIISIMLLTSIFFLIQLIFSTKLIVNSKKKEMIILKSFGVSFKQIMFYHLVNIIFVTLVALTLVLIFYVPLNLIINTSLNSSFFIQINYLSVYGYIFVIWVITTILAALIYAGISYLSFKKKIALALKE